MYRADINDKVFPRSLYTMECHSTSILRNILTIRFYVVVLIYCLDHDVAKGEATSNNALELSGIHIN